MSGEGEWFKDWFDSPYYSILYQNRDTQEAEQFIDRLLGFLQPVSGSNMLDLACGSGRHSIYLATKGYDVTGIDLAPHSIAEALKSQQPGLEFYVHDIRNLFRTNYYQYIFNFFTSFGYFEHENDNIKVLSSAYKGLVSGGTMVIDFLNATKVQQNLPSDGTKECDGVNFVMHKHTDGKFIYKDIRLNDSNGTERNYTERVQALKLVDFQRYFDLTGFKLQAVFGSYSLDAFDEQASDRLILVIQK